MSTPRRKAPRVDEFVVLVVEDDPKVAENIKESLEAVEDVYVVQADDRKSAKNRMEQYLIDAAVVDLRLKGNGSAGYDVIDDLSELAPNAPVVIATKHLNQNTSILRFVGSERVIKVLNKEDESSKQVTPPIRALVERWRGRRVSISNGTLVRDLLWSRKERPQYRFRKARRELERELERIYRGLFGGIRGIEGGDVDVTLKPIERKGLSPAVTVEAIVTIGRDAAGKPVPGNRCVVKVGPVAALKEEVEKYESFVQFGVRMAQRVELLSHTSERALGGIAYSFAGGVFGESLVSLDELLRRLDGQHLAEEAIRKLFNRDEKNWYGVECGEVSATDYMEGAEFQRCFKRLHGSLEKLQKGFSEKGISFFREEEQEDPEEEKRPGRFLVPGAALTIPPTNVTGYDPIYAQQRTCLVHGDMHGGNVMIELGPANGQPIDKKEEGGLRDASLKRTCLIDYGSAGRGPRGADAAALQASIRLADAAAIAEAVAPGVSDKDLSGSQLCEATIEAARRVQVERKLFEQEWRVEPDGEPAFSHPKAASWTRAASLLTAKMRHTFDEMDRQEYLSIAIPCAIRQFGYDLGPLARVRLLAWLSAMYEAMSADLAAA